MIFINYYVNQLKVGWLCSVSYTHLDVYKRQVQNRLEHTINNLDNVVENITTAESRIRDTDMAEEMVNLSLIHIQMCIRDRNKCETWQDMRLVTELANDIYVNGVRTCRQMKF